MSAMLAHPLTETRRPALTHTSALAVPGAGIMAEGQLAGMAAITKTAATGVPSRNGALSPGCLLTG